jgi:hypothetical protein
VTKEIVTLAIDTQTGEIEPTAPFMVNSGRRGLRFNCPYEDEPGIIEQFRPGERQARFEAEWTEGEVRQARRRCLIGRPACGGDERGPPDLVARGGHALAAPVLTCPLSPPRRRAGR